MPQIIPQSDPRPTPAHEAASVGCVSFLNATPLIEGLAERSGDRVVLDVPSRLLQRLDAGTVDVALCPVIDYFRSRSPLALIPVGGISCAGPTLTVRLFSRVPPEQIQRVHADVDSHTSVALLRVLLARDHGVRPEVVPYDRHAPGGGNPETCMLIGDKVVTAPPDDPMPHQIDLGERWHAMTGLPFVFAIWMCRRQTDLGELPRRLVETRRHNVAQTDAIAQRHAPRHGWPVALAQRYLGTLLHFTVTEAHLRAIELFADMAAQEGLIAERRPLYLHPQSGKVASLEPV